MAHYSLTPDYILLLKKYKNDPCPYYNKKHSVCKNLSSSGRLIRSPAAIKDFNSASGNAFTPAGNQIDHIVPLCLGGPDCPCNMQYLKESDHRTKTKRDLQACYFFQVRLWTYKDEVRKEMNEPEAVEKHCVTKFKDFEHWMESFIYPREKEFYKYMPNTTEPSTKKEKKAT